MPVIAPWLNPPDFIGAARAGSEVGLSEAQMHQQAMEHAAELSLRRDELGARMSEIAEERGQKDRENNAAMALRQQALLQQGIIGSQRVKNQADAISAREALEKSKPEFANTGGGLMQFDPVTKQWSLVPGSVKPETQTITTHVPPDVTPEKTIPGAHFWNSDTVIPAVTNAPGYTVVRRVPIGSSPPVPAAAALTKAQSALPDFGSTASVAGGAGSVGLANTPLDTPDSQVSPSQFKSADEVKAAYRHKQITYDEAVRQLQDNFNMQ